ncbi:MAG: cupredoxin domain-containing protein [Actinomycetota bacterium]
MAAGMAAAGMAGPTPAGASGGGGCGAPLTEATGTTVAIRGFCFTPTVLHVSPGTDVSFVNRDGVPHNVLGAGGEWGSFERLRRGVPTTYRFEASGTFAFSCVYHPGMVGTVVVGDGVGAGSAVDIRPVAATRPAREPAQQATTGWRMATAISVGMLLLTVAAAAGQRRHLLGRR